MDDVHLLLEEEEDDEIRIVRLTLFKQMPLIKDFILFYLVQNYKINLDRPISDQMTRKKMPPSLPPHPIHTPFVWISFHIDGCCMQGGCLISG